MQILTHRWLEPHNKDFHFIESSKGAFINHLSRGFGIEFDVNFSGDHFPFISHDQDLKRISNWKDKRRFFDLRKEEILAYKINNNAFISFIELLEYINSYRKPFQYSAIHLKSKFQTPFYIDIILSILNCFSWIWEKIFIFDIKVETAIYIKSKNKHIKLFPSVSHSYDIKRFSHITGWTLLSISEVLKNKDIFDGVWLDEWDRKDENWTKIFYSKENFDIFKNIWFLIWLVTPELHAKSPWLLAWEKHQDCRNIKILKKRFQEIIDLNPDFICSDYLDFVNL